MADKPPSPAAEANTAVQTDRSPGASPVRGGSEKYPLVNDTQEKEDSFDLVAARDLPSPTGLIGTIAYIIKGALGAGILGAHAGYANAGLIAVPMTAILATYMGYCLTVLVLSAQVIYKRTAIPKMSYADVGQACLTLSQNKLCRKMAKPFRYFIDFVVCLDLFGACCCYQLMISGTIKQIVENTQHTSVAGIGPGYPNLRYYLLMMALPMIIISLIKRLDILAKFSIVGNFFVVLCVGATVYYSLTTNPSMSGMKFFTSIKGFFTFIGMTTFSMSCSGIVISLECNMRQPTKWPIAMGLGMVFIVCCVITIGLFGYSAYGENSKTPVTFHFPMAPFPIFLKVSIALMLFITHAVNFWVPFSMVFQYIKKCHKKERVHCWEYFYRVLFCFMCTILSVVFPSVNKLMGFIGAFAITNMAFIFPTTIWLVTTWYRPGLGKFKWRLIVGVFIIFFAIIIFIAGTLVSIKGLVEIFSADAQRIDELDEIDTGEYI